MTIIFIIISFLLGANSVQEEKRSVKESAKEEARRIEERKRQGDLYAERRSEELSKVEILFEQGIRQSQGAYRKVARKDPEQGGGLLTLEPVKDVYVSTSFWQVSFINHSDQPSTLNFSILEKFWMRQSTMRRANDCPLLSMIRIPAVKCRECRV